VAPVARRTLPALLLAGCAAPLPPTTAACPAGLALWAFGADWHTEVALPADALAGPLAALRRWLPGARVVMLGFGKRDFFMAEPPGLAEWLAAPLPGRAVIRASALAAPPAAGGDREVVPLATDAAGLAGLTRFLAAQFATEAGALAPPVEPPARGRAFFAARETYTLAFNCNRWTVEALAAAGLPVAAPGVLTRSDAMAEARRAAAACGGSARVAPRGRLA
jgi:hypothetical protein